MGAMRRTTAAKFLAIGVLAGIAAMATACGSQGAASAPKSSGPEATAVAAEASQARERRIALADDAVRNGRYELPDIGAFQLKDGNFQEKYGEGATQVKRVGVVTVAFGDLDGDAVEDAVVVLWANTGGSGTFMYLAPVLNRDGKGQQAGAQLLGDRVQIRSLAVNSGKIRVELLAQGSTDPMVSPALQSAQEYAVQGGKLARLTPAGPTVPATPRPAQQPSSQPGRDVPSGLLGAIWTWQRFVDNGEKGSFLLPFPAAYRLELLPDGKFLAQADCNTAGGGYSLDGSRLSFAPGPTTLAECKTGSRSGDFIRMLGQVSTYVLKGDALSLNLKADGGDMVFTRLNSVTGRIASTAGEVAPSGGTAEVMIVNGAGQQIGGSLVQARLPMEFEAPFKPANIDPAAAYTLEVTIRDAQKNVVFRNSRPYPVLTQGNPTYHLEVEVQRAR